MILKQLIGNIIRDLFKTQDQGVPIEQIVNAANRALSTLAPEERRKATYDINAKEWRAWSNPEFLLRPFGVRLEEIEENAAKSILEVMKATFSPEGYEKAIAAMRINHFLGELCQMPKVMNQYSYNFLVFGTPSTTKSWGWTLYGHHLCLNVFLRGSQVFISPTFTGAEPNVIDDGPWFGTAILHAEGELGLKLMKSLPKEQKEIVQTFKQLRD